MCHFLPVYHLGIVFLGWVEGQNITGLINFPQLFLVRDLYRLSLTLILIRQINLPVWLHLPETYRFYAPSRYWTSTDCFIFEITLLSLSLSRITFSGRFRSVPHWAVIRTVFLHYLISIRFFLNHSDPPDHALFRLLTPHSVLINH